MRRIQYLCWICTYECIFSLYLCLCLCLLCVLCNKVCRMTFKQRKNNLLCAIFNCTHRLIVSIAPYQIYLNTNTKHPVDLLQHAWDMCREHMHVCVCVFRVTDEFLLRSCSIRATIHEIQKLWQNGRMFDDQRR